MFLAGQRVVKEGAAGKHLLLICYGVANLQADNIVVGNSLGPGDCFGLPNFLGIDSVYRASVFAQVVCHLRMMAAPVWTDLLQWHPQDRERIEQMRQQVAKDSRIEEKAMQSQVVREKRQRRVDGAFHSHVFKLKTLRDGRARKKDHLAGHGGRLRRGSMDSDSDSEFSTESEGDNDLLEEEPEHTEDSGQTGSSRSLSPQNAVFSSPEACDDSPTASQCNVLVGQLSSKAAGKALHNALLKRTTRRSRRLPKHAFGAHDPKALSSRVRTFAICQKQVAMRAKVLRCIRNGLRDPLSQDELTQLQQVLPPLASTPHRSDDSPSSSVNHAGVPDTRPTKELSRRFHDLAVQGPVPRQARGVQLALGSLRRPLS